MVTFDGVQKTIFLNSTGTYDVSLDLYSEWKEWAALTDNLKFAKAFDAVGGDDIGGGQSVSPYYFLRTDNGWRIQSPESDGDVIVSGNLFPRVSTDSLFLPSIGDFTVLITQQLSARAIVVETGVSGLTTIESEALDLVRQFLDAKVSSRSSKADVIAASQL